MMETLFPPPVRREVSDDDVATLVRRAILRKAGRGGREADLYLATVSAEQIVDELRQAGAVITLPASK
jgi:hypothetical protein